MCFYDEILLSNFSCELSIEKTTVRKHRRYKGLLNVCVLDKVVVLSLIHI